MGDGVIIKILKLVLIIFFMGLIFSFSVESGKKSSRHSDSFIIKSMEFVFRRNLTIHEKEIYIKKFVYPIRKSAHFWLYFMLGLSILSFVKEFVLLSWRQVGLTTFMVFLYACSDELHQLFVPGRSGEIVDVFIDTIGGFVGIGYYFVIYYLRRMTHGQEKTIG